MRLVNKKGYLSVCQLQKNLLNGPDCPEVIEVIENDFSSWLDFLQVKNEFSTAGVVAIGPSP